MILPQGKQLLEPASRKFIWISLLVAWLLQFILAIGLGGSLSWDPDILAIVLMIWVMREPTRVGLATAFIFGVIVDIEQASILGIHALEYSLLCYAMLVFGRRLVLFGPVWQALQIFPIFLISQIIMLLIHLSLGQHFLGWSFFLKSFLSSILWPLISVILILPQHQASNPDAERPL